MATTEIRMIDPVLTSIAQSYRNESFIGQHLFPIVNITHIKGKILIFASVAFQPRAIDRALRASSNRIPTEKINYIEFGMRERDVEISLDYLEEEETPDFLQYEQQMTRQLFDLLLLNREKEIADFVQNSSNYPTDQVKTITSAEAFDDYTNGYSPLKAIQEGISKIRQKVARYPNVMVLGEATFRALINHPEIIERIKYSGISRVNTKILSELLSIRNIYVGLAVYDNGSNFTDIWSDIIILAYFDEENESRRTPYGFSFGYLLQKSGYPEVDTYYENGGKIKIIRATDNYTFTVTSPQASYLISNTNHLS